MDLFPLISVAYYVVILNKSLQDIQYCIDYMKNDYETIDQNLKVVETLYNVEINKMIELNYLYGDFENIRSDLITNDESKIKKQLEIIANKYDDLENQIKEMRIKGSADLEKLFFYANFFLKEMKLKPDELFKPFIDESFNDEKIEDCILFIENTIDTVKNFTYTRKQLHSKLSDFSKMNSTEPDHIAIIGEVIGEKRVDLIQAIYKEIKPLLEDGSLIFVESEAKNGPYKITGSKEREKISQAFDHLKAKKYKVTIVEFQELFLYNGNTFNLESHRSNKNR